VRRLLRGILLQQSAIIHMFITVRCCHEGTLGKSQGKARHTSRGREMLNCKVHQRAYTSVYCANIGTYATFQTEGCTKGKAFCGDQAHQVILWLIVLVCIVTQQIHHS
jgi:uncharacterized membrane protein